MATNPLARILGPDAFARLVAWRGGCRIYIPRLEQNLGPFAAVLGEDAAMRLYEEARGCPFDVPRGGRSKPLSAVRIRRMVGQGMSQTAIARELRCTDRAVRKRLARS